VFNIFKDLFKSKPKQVLSDFSDIGVDMHSHLIPAIDDGSKSNEQSLEMITRLQDSGFSKLITTPHIMSGGYDNTTDIIQGETLKLDAYLKSEGVDITLDCSSEYYLDGHFEDLIKEKDLMPFGNDYILFELSYMFRPTNAEKIIFELGLDGYRPILAHPERYNYLADKNLKHLKELKDKGALFQLNLFSLVGGYGPVAKQIGEKLIKEKMIDFVGTDLHNPSQLEFLDKLLESEALSDLIQQDILKNKVL
jgi:protein-tyrosine phosphatase